MDTPVQFTHATNRIHDLPPHRYIHTFCFLPTYMAFTTIPNWLTQYHPMLSLRMCLVGGCSRNFTDCCVLNCAFLATTTYNLGFMEGQPTSDDLPTYGSLAAAESNLPNSRFGRWREWLV